MSCLSSTQPLNGTPSCWFYCYRNLFLTFPLMVPIIRYCALTSPCLWEIKGQINPASYYRSRVFMCPSRRRQPLTTGRFNYIYPDNKVHGANTGPSGADRTGVGITLAPWTLISGYTSLSCNVYVLTCFIRTPLPWASAHWLLQCPLECHWNAIGWPSVHWDTTGRPNEYL